MRHLRMTALAVVGLGVICPPCQAATCQVPSAGYATIQAAVDDPSCTEIVLAAQSYAESPVIARALTLSGAGSGATFIAGQVEVTAGAVELRELEIRTPPGIAGEGLLAHSGAAVSGFDLVVVLGTDVPLFADGFESGDLSAWSPVTQ